MLLCFLCLSLFLSIPACKKELPTSPDSPEIVNDRIDTVYYSCKFEIVVSVDAAATGDIYLFIDDDSLGSPNDIDFSPLPDNPDISEGTVIFWKIVNPGTHSLTFRLAHYNDLESGQITPGEWVIKMVVSSHPDLMIGGSVQEQNIGLWKLGQDYSFTFIIGDMLAVNNYSFF